MNATWGIDRHVSQTMQVVIRERVGIIRAWRILRLVWLSGAMADCIVPDAYWDQGAQAWAGMWVPESQHARN